jgi:hypothetical protein
MTRKEINESREHDENRSFVGIPSEDALRNFPREKKYFICSWRRKERNPFGKLERGYLFSGKAVMD